MERRLARTGHQDHSRNSDASHLRLDHRTLPARTTLITYHAKPEGRCYQTSSDANKIPRIKGLTVTISDNNTVSTISLLLYSYVLPRMQFQRKLLWHRNQHHAGQGC